MNNKEVIDILQKYFLKQEHELVTKMLANCIVDLNRFLNFQDLSILEADHLIKRTKNNMKEIVACIKDNTNNDLQLIHEPFHK
jgi:hypothetical protein